MKNVLNIHFKNSKGFTLLEILVVMAIIGILSAVVVGAVNSSREKAKVAKAKVELSQILRAAELVYNEYGYYPNDSHVSGSVVCLKDIVIHQATSKTWSSYMNLCNDPWGRPYEWNNQCTAGSIRKSTPIDPTCLPFTDSNPGPIGVTVVGADGINNVCTGDDICSGQRNHLVYGYGGTASSGSDGDGGPIQMCAEVLSQCSELSALGCGFRTGCTLQGSSCTGSYGSSCTAFADQASCTTNTGCSWATGGCGGTATSCNSYGDSNGCSAASGCSWGQSCNGAVSCSAYNSDATSCSNSGCTYAAPSCGGTFACSQFNGNQAACPISRCTWSNSGGGKCNGGSQSCSSFVQSSCTPSGCSWSGSSCNGSPSCSGFNSTQCSTTSGCINSQACSGSASSCNSYGNSSSCGVASGCSWTTQSCSGSYSASCTPLNNQSSCQAQGTCTWASQTCTGTAASCSTNVTQNSCTAQTGCSWQ